MTAFASPRLTVKLHFRFWNSEHGEPVAMSARGIEKLGSIGTFVERKQKVVVKPIVGWDVPSERGGNTHPLLVREIITQCYQADAREVHVFENICDEWERCYANIGISRTVHSSNGTRVSGTRKDCGACEHACPTEPRSAIVVEPHRIHK